MYVVLVDFEAGGKNIMINERNIESSLLLFLFKKSQSSWVLHTLDHERLIADIIDGSSAFFDNFSQGITESDHKFLQKALESCHWTSKTEGEHPLHQLPDRPILGHMTCEKADGSTWTCQVTTHLVSQDQPELFLSFFSHESEAHRESQGKPPMEIYHRLFENHRDGILVIQNEMIIFANSRLAEMGHYRVEDIVGKHYSEFIFPDDLHTVADRYRRRMSGEDVEAMAEVRAIKKDRIILTTEMMAEFIAIDGKPANLITVRNITRQKTSETKLKIHERIFQHAQESIAIADVGGRFLEVNASFEIMFGFLKAEILGKPINEILDDDSTATILMEISKSGASRCECRCRLKSGQFLDTELSAFSLHDEGGTISHYILMMRDISERVAVESKMRTSEELFRTLSEQISDGMLIIVDTLIYWVNKTFTELSGYSISELTGIPLDQFFDSTFIEVVRETEKVEKSHSKVHHFSTSFQTRLGMLIDLDIITQKITFDGREGVQLIVRDMTILRSQERALKNAKERFQGLFEHSPVGICQIDAEGRISTWNSALHAMFTLPQGSLFFQSIQDVIKRVIREEDRALLTNLCKSSGSPHEQGHVFSLTKNDGELLVVELSIFHYPKNGDTQSEAELFFHDVTERSRAERALRESERKYRTLIERSNDVFYSANLEGKITYVSPQIEKLGYQPDEIVHGDLSQLIHPDDYERAMNEFMTSMETGEEFPTIFRMVGKNQQFRWFEDLGKITFDANGNPTGLVGFLRDITERKKAEEKLQNSDQRFRDIVDNALEWIWEVDHEWKYIYSSPIIEKLLGYTPEEILGKSIADFMPESIRRKHEEEFHRIQKDREVLKEFVSERYHKDGRVLLFSTSGIPFFDHSGEFLGYRGMDIDITERRKSEEALKESEEKFRIVSETSPIAIFIHEGGNFLYVNPATVKVSGYSEEELMCMSFWDVVHPDHNAMVKSRGQQRVGGADPPSRYQIMILTKQGKTCWLEIMGSPLEIGGRRFVMGSAVDITDRKHVEDELLASLNEKKVLLKEIHHRVKNNLQIISSLLHLQARRFQDPVVLGKFTECQARIQSMALIHTKLYQSEGLSKINFADYLHSLISYLSDLFGVASKAITLETRIEEIHLDLDRSIPLGLIVNELLSNCLKHAFSDGRTGKIEIELTGRESGMVTLLISDDGAGIPAHINVHDSDTLGLTLVYSLVDQLEGSVSHECQSGSRWSITIPV